MVLLRAGTLSGWLGSALQIPEAQEIAKDLISESMAVFESLGDKIRVGEAQTELSYCYWREGAFDEARVMLQEALRRLGDAELELRAVAILRSAVVESSSLRLHDALRILMESATLFEACSNHSIRGRYHNELATTLKNLGLSEKRADLIDQALIEYAAASFHFEQASHVRYCARVENNLGFLSSTVGKFAEAHEHLNRSQRLFDSLKDSGSVAQVDDTRSRTLLTQGRNVEAEKVIKNAVRTLETGGQQALLAEALTTHGTALARLHQHAQARGALERAITVAETAGDPEGAGRAALTLIEELFENLSHNERRNFYERADHLIGESQHAETLVRLRAGARKVFLARGLDQTDRGSKALLTSPHASPKTAALMRQARDVAASNSTVFIAGETGAGKEVLARLIHEWSGRNGKFVVLDCAALPATLLESHLFGHHRGAFRGAIDDHAGAVQDAAGGTLFLTAVDELSVASQSKILRLLDGGEVYPVGASLPELVDVRIIAATTQAPEEMIAKGTLRDGLYYRLNVLRIDIPPLRERPEDIIALARQFIAEVEGNLGCRVRFSDESLAAIQKLPLFGNVWELRMLIERLARSHQGETITPKAVNALARQAASPLHHQPDWEPCDLTEEVRLFERRHIEQALKASGGAITKAAKLLGLKHHQSLMTMLKTRHQELLAARLPPQKRHRSIISKRLKLVKR
ncbi:MAG: sigma 54-interacting transcriptional regulator [Pyrinomonadaceae bacterium]|nr:sigma 54-interacting transcriptional regulator [Pyrinomonadaceae bacterium]